MSTPTAMHVEFGLFHGDDLLHRGGLMIGEIETRAVFGEHRHFNIDQNPPLEIQIFSGLIIDHRFDTPACPLTLWIYQIDESDSIPKQHTLVRAALRMGVHTSDDWESIDLGADHNLAFRCTEIEPAA